MPQRPRFFNLKINTQSPVIHQGQHPLRRTKSDHSAGSGRLKNLEKLIDASKSRIITPYEKNHTAALSLPLSSDELQKKATDPTELFDHCRESIIEHAARRVDLFFYTLVAYHKTDHALELGGTRLQHGAGRRSSEFFKLTEACHSSLSPSILDETIKHSHSDEDTPAYHIKKSILSNTHFLDSLNSTVELPHFVNELDDELENATHCRKTCIDILKEVAQGDLSVVNGLNKFFIMLSNAFTMIEDNKQLTKHGQPYLLRDSAEAPKQIRENLVTLQKFGTFHKKWSEQTQSIYHPYIALLLRLTPKEITLCMKNEKTRDTIYKKKISTIQREILSTQSACDYSAYATKRSFSHD